MLSVALILPVLSGSWVDAALWDLLGLTLWGSLIASGILTIAGLVRRSAWKLMLAAVFSLPLCGLVAFMYTTWILVVPVTQVTLATMMVAVRRTQHT
jgi:hypothetical protein